MACDQMNSVGRRFTVLLKIQSKPIQSKTQFFKILLFLNSIDLKNTLRNPSYKNALTLYF